MVSTIPLAAQQTTATKMRKQIDRLVQYDTRIDNETTPGFIVGIIDGPNTLVLSFGTRDKESSDTLTVDDVFAIGSVTKVFTAALFAELDAQERLSLNTSIDSLLPPEYRNPSMSTVTISKLLSHQSGLPRDPTRVDQMGSAISTYELYTPEDILEEYHQFSGSQRMFYSNFGYALSESLGYGATQKDYAELLADLITEPLNMRNTSTDLAHQSVPNFDYEGEPCEPAEFGAFAASGGVVSSMEDMLKFVDYCFERSPEALWDIQGPGLNADMRMALGWHVVDQRKDFRVYAHTGRTNSNSAFLGIVRKTGTAVVILANSARGTDDLGMELLRIMNDNWHRKS